MTGTDKILARKDAGIGYLTFNNPERHNAVSLEMWEATATLLDDFAADKDVRVVVLTGAGTRAFVSGADISRFGSERASPEDVARYNAMAERAFSAIHDFPKPTIAMIRGYCIGGGLGIAVSCDIRVCTPNSRFAVPAAKLGLGYDYKGLKRLIDVVGPAFAKEIFYTARQFDAQEARAMMLVNRIVPEDEVESYVKGYAGTIAENAPLTIEAVKLVVNEIIKDESQRDMARCAEMVARCYTSGDYVEGRTAFMEKRKPVFTGT